VEAVDVSSTLGSSGLTASAMVRDVD
jgi:hypothetical protein